MSYVLRSQLGPAHIRGRVDENLFQSFIVDTTGGVLWQLELALLDLLAEFPIYQTSGAIQLTCRDRRNDDTVDRLTFCPGDREGSPSTRAEEKASS